MRYKPSVSPWEPAPITPPRVLKHDAATPEGRRELRAALAAHNATVGKSRPSPHFDPTKPDPAARYKPSQPYYAKDGTVGGVGQMNERDRRTFADVRPSLPAKSNNREVQAIVAQARSLIRQLGGDPSKSVTNAATVRHKPVRPYWQD